MNKQEREGLTWRRAKPLVIVAAVLAGGLWWFQALSPNAPLKDGEYTCQGVFVNENQKYEVLVDDAGNPYSGSAAVRGGALVSLGGDTQTTSDQLESFTLRKRGTSHFHVTNDPAPHSYYAVACDYAGE